MANSVGRIQHELLQRFTPFIHPHLQRFMQGGYSSYAPGSAGKWQQGLERGWRGGPNAVLAGQPVAGTPTKQHAAQRQHLFCNTPQGAPGPVAYSEALCSAPPRSFMNFSPWLCPCAPRDADFGEVALESVEMEVEMSVGQVAGWVQSWSAFKPYCQQHGEQAARALLERYCDDLVAALGVPGPQATVRTRWPLHLLLARRPVPLPHGEQAGQEGES